MSNFKLNEKATDFLLYSYFGFDSSEIIKSNPNIQYKCAYRAYLDLARTVKYVHASSELEKSKSNDELGAFKKARDERISDVCDNLAKSIESFTNGFDDFDSWHNNECDQIINMMNKPYEGDKKLIKDEFTYGQAQKWINMTLKYLWLLDKLPQGLSEESLHVPIDSFILENLQDKVDRISNNGDTYKYQGKAWSAISDPEDYKKLQDIITEIAKEEGKTPIKWEAYAWMEVAKKRSSK